MMLKEKSRKPVGLKTLLFVPLVAVGLLAFAHPEIIRAEETLKSESTTAPQKGAIDIKGTWKLIEANGTPVSGPRTQVKMITDTHFFWINYDESGNVGIGAGGTYTLVKNVYTESIDLTLAGMAGLKGRKATYDIKIVGTKMYTMGKVEGLSESEEVYERIK